MGPNDNELTNKAGSRPQARRMVWLPYHKAGILHGHVVNDLLLLKIKSSPCSIVISSTLKNSIEPFLLDEMGAGTEATPGSPRTLTVNL